jgi:hypothetical protein
VLDFLLDAISGRPTTYLIAAAIVFVDDFIPFAPGDTAMITAGILAANDALIVALVVVAGAVGGSWATTSSTSWASGSAAASRAACCAASAARRSTSGPSGRSMRAARRS